MKGAIETSLTHSINYKSSAAGKVDSVNEKYIQVDGGETLTFNGSGFDASTSITIDSIVCVVQTPVSNPTTISCITGVKTITNVEGLKIT